jgi:hypothetical protein
MTRKLLAFALALAGPFAGQLLGDYGARVIKIEPPRATRSGAGACWTRRVAGCGGRRRHAGRPLRGQRRPRGPGGARAQRIRYAGVELGHHTEAIRREFGEPGGGQPG